VGNFNEQPWGISASGVTIPTRAEIVPIQRRARHRERDRANRHRLPHPRRYTTPVDNPSTTMVDVVDVEVDVDVESE